VDESSTGSPDDASEIIGLGRQLQEIDQRLQALMPQDIDAVIGADGKSYMLQRAQLRLLRSVGEQRAMARQLRTERERLVAAQAVAKIGSWSLDLAHGHIDWSQETHKIFETDPDRFEPAYEDVMQRLHPDDRQQVRVAFEQSLQNGSDVVLEHRLAFIAGTTKFVEQRWQVEHDGDGVPIRAFGTCQDITDRRRSEEALRQKQTQLSRASRLGRIGAWSLDLVAEAVLWSEEAYAIHEVAPGTPLNIERAVDYYVPEMRELLRRAVARCATHGTPFDLELELVTGHGRRIWVRSIGEAVRDADGVVRLIQGAIQDLSDRKQAEKETHRLATRLTTTLESLTIGFYTTDKDWRFTYINAEAERMFERRREDLIGGCLWEEFPHLLGTVFEDSFRRAVIGRLATVVDGPLWGGQTWVRATAYPSEEGLAVYLRDISAERADHQQLKLLEASVSRLNDMVVITEAAPLDSPGPRIVFVNDAVLRTTGYSREELLGASPRVLQGAKTDRAELDRIRDALAGFEPVHAELINYTQAGEPYWVELDIVPLAGEASGATHFVAVQRDITERKRDQDALRELNQELENRVRLRTAELNVAREAAERATQVKATFLATMSHEIRTPMNGVIGLVEVLSKSYLQPPQMEMVELIRDSADSLLNIIDGILDFSKLEAGQLRIEHAPLRLAGVVEKVCGLLDSIAIKRDVGLTVFVDPDIPGRVFGDELRLRQILLNLIGNAIKFSSGLGRPGRIAVRAELCERGPDRVGVALIVSDNGIGIERDTQIRLFQPFSQADASTTRRFGGTGLGLAITHTLVQLMGGEISVESDPGVGSEFRVLLPFEPVLDLEAVSDTESIVKGLQCRIIGADGNIRGEIAKYLARAGVEPESDQDATTVVPGTMSLEPAKPVRPKILVVEDNEINREVIRRQLQLLAVPAEMATNGKEALRRWRSDEFALILTDLRMPEMDGYALAAAIRAEELPGRRTMIIALTANALPAEQARCLAAGMDAYLAKPVRLSRLRSTLDKWLASSVQPELYAERSAPGAATDPPADIKILKSVVGDDPTDIRAVLATFRDTSERFSNELQTAILAGSVAAAREIAHKLKSGALSVGARQLGKICERIEDVAAAGQSELLADLRTDFEAELLAVHRHLDGLMI
jgi:PAS domain S-box-containing protein